MASEDVKNQSLEYGKPPWVFKGSALYQFHLVKSETARVLIPKEFRLVEAFGYTLGGFFLAKYEDSPVGKFDELVILAGTVWNPPTSCTWASRVIVSSDKACAHGKKEFGLPSQVAIFSKNTTTESNTKKIRFGGFWSNMGMDTTSVKNSMDVYVKEIIDHNAFDLCNIKMTSSAEAPQSSSKGWLGPLLRFSLPSFSGRTVHNPKLLKYSCQVECRLRAAPLAKVSNPSTSKADFEASLDEQRELSMNVMLSKPLLALEFTSLIMKVEAPTVVSE